MFRIGNIKKFVKNGWTYVQCDFNVTGMSSPFHENTIWVAVEEKHGNMLTDDIYDTFVLVPLILGMYFKQDVHIDGCISSQLYHNIQHYLMKIFCNFSDNTSQIKFSVSETISLKKNEIGNIIGTGISCGVDSLVTIYDNYILENNPDFRINGLFFFNCGTHGDYENAKSRQIWSERILLNKRAADELKLPMYILDTNFHAFTHVIGEQKIGYLAIYSCILAFQKVIKRYFTSSNFSYDEIADGRKLSRDFDLAEYCESYMPHLISTERLELIVDGCQYTRAEKVERISDWPIAQKYLNVCHMPIEYANNCSHCEKCMNTLIPLEAIGKLNKFSAVFDKDTYNKYSNHYKKKYVAHKGSEKQMEDSIIEFCKKKGMSLPSHLSSSLYVFFTISLKSKIGKIVRKIGLR